MLRLLSLVTVFLLANTLLAQWSPFVYYNSGQNAWNGDFRARREAWQGSYYNPLAFAPISDWGR